MAETLQSRGFEECHRSRGVTVYKQPEAEILTIAAEGRFAASPEEVRTILLDYENHTQMLERIAESKILHRGADWLLVYQRLSLSVISDRDYTMRVAWGNDGEVKWLHFRTANSLGPPERSGIVRMPVHRGSWQLKPVSNGKATLARYQLRIDMGGLIPDWMVDSSDDFEIPDLYDAIRKKLLTRS